MFPHRSDQKKKFRTETHGHTAPRSSVSRASMVFKSLNSIIVWCHEPVLGTSFRGGREEIHDKLGVDTYRRNIGEHREREVGKTCIRQGKEPQARGKETPESKEKRNCRHSKGKNCIWRAISLLVYVCLSLLVMVLIHYFFIS